MNISRDLIPLRLQNVGRVGSRIWEENAVKWALGGGEVLPVKGSAVRRLPGHVKAAAWEAMEHNAPAPSRGLSVFRNAIAAALSDEWVRPVDAESEILVTNGAMHALSVAFRTMLAPGDRVLIPSPAFFFEGMIRIAGAEPIYLPCDAKDDWRWDFMLIEKAMAAGARLFIACHPSNPTGFLPSPSDLQTLVELCSQYGVTLLSDESYHRLIYDDQVLHSLGTFESDCEIIVVRSLSKSYHMSNWRIGYLAASPEVVEACTKVLEWDCLYCNTVAQHAASAALTGPQGWLDGVEAEFQRNRDLLFEAVCATEIISCVLPSATPFLFLDTSRLKTTSEETAAILLREIGVATVPGQYFQEANYLRVPFGGDSNVIKTMGDRLIQWIARRTA